MRCAPHGLLFDALHYGTFEEGPPPHVTAPSLFCLVLLFASFLATALPRQRFLHALSLAGLQVERVTFYFLDYVLGLYLPLKPAKCVFEGFPLLKSYFSQSNRTSLLARMGPVSYGKHSPHKSRGMCMKFPPALKIQPHRHLHLPRRICICRFHKVRRLLIISRIVRPP